MSLFPIGKSVVATITSGLTGLSTTLANYVAATTPQLKPVENAASFQKTRTHLGVRELSHEDLLYTFCDANDYTSRPYGNLFQSFRIPINSNDRSAMRDSLAGTSLAKLSEVQNFISIEIPRNKYGEMLDGKTIELTIPQTYHGQFYSVTCYSSFYGFNPDLNNQVSDSNPISSLFSGVEPTAENDYNTNIAYLFSNDIATPKDTILTQLVLDNEFFTLDAGRSDDLNSHLQAPLTLEAGVVYNTNLLSIAKSIKVMFDTSIGLVPIVDAVEYVSASTFKLKYEVTNIRFENLTREPFRAYLKITKYTAGSTRKWSTWTPQNRFPSLQNGPGKSIGNLLDPSTQTLLDEPVGIAFLDKGFIIITHPELIANIDLSDAYYSDEDGVTQPYPQAPEERNKFTQVFFQSTQDGEMKPKLRYNSVVTEYTQGYTCLAMPNEFYETTNASYRETYPSSNGSSGQQPIQITELGLYNKFGELVALAKTTKPIQKTKSSVAVFTVNLKI